MAKLDIKQAAINHVEKAVFGVVLLVVLLGLATANWAPYQGTPGEIRQSVTQGQTALVNHSWPQEEREQFPIVKTDERVYLALHKPIDPRPLESSVDPVVDPLGSNEPVREPVLKTLENLMATAGRVFLEVVPEQDETDLESELALADTTEPAEEDEDIPDELRTRSATAAGPAGGEYGGLAEQAVELQGYGSSYGGGTDYDAEMAMSSGEAYDGAAGYSSALGLGNEAYGGPGMMAASLPKKNGQGHVFASVRAVFPLRDQISKYAEATNQSYQQAAANFDIIDFELQRQSPLPGTNQWPEGEAGWEPVDMSVAADILDSTVGFEADVVNGVVTNSVITMPLPMRISGAWRNQATHERIKNFELSPEQVRIEMEMNRRLLQEAVNQKKTLDQGKVKRGGFADFSFDTNQVTASLMGTNMYSGMSMGMGYGGGGGYGAGYGAEDYPGGAGAGYPGSSRSGRSGRSRRGGSSNAAEGTWEKLITDLAKDAENPEEQEKLIREWITKRATVEGELLLFRYLDFSVEPGKTYRYRVRLELNNPNFGKRIADAGGVAHVVAGETRMTEWSNVTDPVTVPNNTYYFLTRVNEPRGNSRLLPSAQMDVYHWDSQYGTMVNQAFDVQMGQPIADEVKTDVIDAAGQEVKEDEKYEFKSESYLVDVIEDLEIDRTFHSNDRIDESLRLNLIRGFRDEFRTEPQALVNDSALERLVRFDGVVQAKQHKIQKNYVSIQKEKTFKHLFDAADALTATAGFGEYGDVMGAGYGEMMMGGGYGEMMMGGQRNRSALRKGRGSSSRRGRSSGGSRGMMMQGY